MERLFSTDLVEGSKKHVDFLTTLHSLGVTLSPITTESLRRYLDLWLPLVQSVQRPRLLDEGAARRNDNGDRTKLLIPPPDVAWLWHCHRLAPSKYEAYVAGRFGVVLEASPPFAVQSSSSSSSSGDSCWVDADAQATRDLWDIRYPDRPFFLPEGPCRGSSPQLTSQQCCEVLHGYDLVASTLGQATFLWQVSRPQFYDEDFLRQGVERYHKFLMLSNFAGNDGVLVPTYQVRKSVAIIVALRRAPCFAAAHRLPPRLQPGRSTWCGTPTFYLRSSCTTEIASRFVGTSSFTTIRWAGEIGRPAPSSTGPLRPPRHCGAASTAKTNRTSVTVPCTAGSRLRTFTTLRRGVQQRAVRLQKTGPQRHTVQRWRKRGAPRPPGGKSHRTGRNGRPYRRTQHCPRASRFSSPPCRLHGAGTTLTGTRTHPALGTRSAETLRTGGGTTRSRRRRGGRSPTSD
jgi:Glycine-rich domain-containing protein-like